MSVNFKNTFQNKFSVFISTIIHPLITSPITFVLIAYFNDGLTTMIIFNLGIVICAISIIPFLYINRMKSLGLIENIDIPDRKKREKPFIKGTFLFFSTFLLLFLLKSPKYIIVLMLIYSMNTAISTIITKYWKISIHGMAFGIAIAAIALFISSKYYYLLFLLPAIIYSRVYLKAHTKTQVVMGIALGLILTTIQIKVYMIL